MACLCPLDGCRAREVSASGRRRIVFNVRDGLIDLPVTVPCGQCVGCRLERSRVWAVRAVHEASLWPENCFVTLTYDQLHVPPDGVRVRDVQLFMMRLIKAFGRAGIRRMYCGEYGERFGRPHYHLVLFNVDFPDKVFLRENANGDRIYESAMLKKLWPFGRCEVGSVSFQSAAYTARYVMKKVTGAAAEAHYQGRSPEFFRTSRNPGLGRGWFDRFAGDAFPHDDIIMNGKSFRVPRYYEGIYELENSAALVAIKRTRRLDAAKHSDNNADARLLVRLEVQNARVKLLKRELD
ncbi:MAG: replication initiator protein [Microvirus sp.]|nr:MAG: replication initiator protein [Microvirus sp.]